MCEPTVERSTKRLTRLPSITPPAPVATSSEACSDGRLASTVSQRSAMSLGDDAACAPSATSLSTASFRVSNTVSWCFASIRRRAIGKPIFPRPMNPISMVLFPYFVIASEAKQSILSSCGEVDCFASLAMTDRTSTCPLRLVQFREHFARDAKAVDAGGHAGIDRNLHEDFADFVAADPVGQRALDVHAQLVRPVEDRDHGEVEHAAGLARQFVAAPHRAPAIFGDQFLERPVEIVDVLQRIVDIGLAEHGFAHFQALVVGL